MIFRPLTSPGAALLLALVPAGALAAVPAEPPAPAPAAAMPAALDPAYYDLFDAITAGIDGDQTADIAANAVIAGLKRNNADLAALAARRSQLEPRLHAAIAPYMRIWIARSKAVRRDAMAAALAARMNPAEAREIATFYISPLGKRVMATIVGNLTFDAQVDAAMKVGDAKPAKDAAAQDQRATMSGYLGALLPSLKPDEAKAMVAFTRTDGFKKLPMISAAMAAIPEPGFEELATAEERADFGKAIFTIVTDEMRAK